MNIIKKLLASLTALVMAVGFMIGGSVPVMAAGTGTITITPPANTPSNATNEYKIYKVFDGVSNGTSSTTGTTMSYTLPAGKTLTGDMATYFATDGAGNVSAKDAAKGTDGLLTADAIAAIKTFVQNDTLVDTVTTIGTTAGTSKSLSEGYYYVTTTTGSAVMVTSTKPTAEVQDKTTVPSVDKKITAVKESASVNTDAGSIKTGGKNAIAEVGSVLTFEADITLGKNAKLYVFEDKLPKDRSGNYTLRLVAGSGKVYKNTISEDNLVAYSAENQENYSYSEQPGNNDDWTFKIEFKDTFISGLETQNIQKLIVVYQATVTSAALQQSSPATNSATISWGDPQHKNTSAPSQTNTYNAKITVNKTFENLQKDTELGNSDSAQFVLTRKNGAETQYYSLSGNNVTWQNSIENATPITFTENGSASFAGLANGTYTLVESKVPSGYNKAADQEITINDSNTDQALTDSNLIQAKVITNTTGALLPSTGGIGTTIFYVAGGAIIIVVVGMIMVRRNKNA